jgi:hypothetical protein
MRARRIAFAWIVRHWAKTLPSRGLSFGTPKSDRPIQKSISCIALGQRIGLTHYVVEIRQKPLGEYKGPFRSLAPPTRGFGHPFSSAGSATHPHYADAASAWEDQEDLGLDDSCYRGLTLRAPAQRKL